MTDRTPSSLETRFLERGDRARLAFRKHEGRGPTLVWLSGFRSDMNGTKVRALEAWAVSQGVSFLAFDYSGCGASSGRFEDFALGDWTQDTLAILDHAAPGPLVLVGSSMGAWIACLAALDLQASGAPHSSLQGLILIAPALDFTESLWHDRLPEAAKAAIEKDGVWLRPSSYGDGPYPITKRLIEEGRRRLLLGAPIEILAPVRILQGMLDADVAWDHALRVAEALRSPNVHTILIKDGDHRLSRDQDIDLLLKEVEALCAPAPKA